MKKALACMLVLIALTACQETLEEQEFQVRSRTKPEFSGKVESSDQGTRTTLDGDQKILWDLSDKIDIYLKTTLATPYVVKEGTEGKTSCSFVEDVTNKESTGRGAVLQHNIGVYHPDKTQPGTLQATTEGYEYTTTSPREKTYGPVAVKSFADMTMVAVSENTTLGFKNSYGAIKLQLKGTDKIKKITVKSNGNDLLSGKHKIKFGKETLPTVEAVGEMNVDWFNEKSILLDDVQLTETPISVYIVVPAADFVKGFKIIVTNNYGIRKVFEAPAGEKNKVSRSNILIMPVVQIQMPGPGIISITHNLNEFTIPNFTGEYVSGKISWGDEQQEEFKKGISHTYANSGDHVVSIQTNTYEVTIPSLKGIIKVDLSKF